MDGSKVRLVPGRARPQKAARPLTWPLTFIFFPIHFTCKAQLGRAFGKPQKLQFVRDTKWSVKCRAKVKEEGFFYFLPV